MPDIRSRFFILKLICFIMLAALIIKLVQLQIVEGEQYSQLSKDRISTTFVEEAPRGEIKDRYGVSLVTNEIGYSLQISKSDKENDDFNAMLLELVGILDDYNCDYTDTLPISDYPYEFTFDDTENSFDVEKEEWFEARSKSFSKLDDDMSASEVITYLMDRYGISPQYSDTEIRKLAGIRYEGEIRGYSQSSPFTLCDDIPVEAVTQIKERQADFPNVMVTNTYVRKYNYGSLAAHILGRIGKINESEYEENKDNGYSYNDVIGKQGIEKFAESYLRGTDGTIGTVKASDGTDITIAEDNEAVPGNFVVLTIDSKLQKAAEDSLEKNITAIREASSGENKTGQDASAGAAVVIDVRNGDVLACASYPTYDPNEFNSLYSELSSDETKPLWNRAVSGTYTPGSTFKPLIAIAALETGIISVNEKIEDQGVFSKYRDYQPRCWIWTDYHMTHGSINVTTALEVSCNYFFYEVGDRMGIDTIDEYAQSFGLGEYTGIELPEESKGQVASPEYKESVVESVTEKSWFAADTLQAAIGQSYNMFTPVQLANYAATIANGGTRYMVNLIKSINSSVDGSVIKETEPKIEEQINISESTLSAVKQGMKKVADEGSARNIFNDYPIQIAGKTGTAQVGSQKSNNALFVAFAPYDNPEIAVAIAIEQGVAGTNAATAAKEIFDAYFGLSSEDEESGSDITEDDIGILLMQ